jgi:hypothetical protein
VVEAAIVFLVFSSSSTARPSAFVLLAAYDARMAALIVAITREPD